MSTENTTQNPLPSSRAQPRDLLSDKEKSSCLGDGGCSSTMTLKGGKIVRFGEVCLPASKSESNRVLMIAAYGGFELDFQNLSESKDTQTLLDVLRGLPPTDSIATPPTYLRNDIGGNPRIIDIADCGTAARFLTTFLACRSGRWLLTGTERMKQRPMAPLVDALRVLGAEIQYVENEGCLPLRITGKPLSGGMVSIDMTQSSQFASSLLLAAPMFSQGLELELLGSLSSLPYLDMTLAMMRHFSARAERQSKKVVVESQPYQRQLFTIEPDWTAASYWYEMAALSEECEMKLRSLSLSKGRLYYQGDSIIAEWMKSLGVKTITDGDSLVLRKISFEKQPLHFDFSATPDVFPTMAATCAGLQLEAHFTGIANLTLKESDRVEAMRVELEKIGTKLEYVSENELVLMPSAQLPFFEKTHPLCFASHNDHRIVMALAPFSLLFGEVFFDHPEVVIKSYPDFWKDADFLCFPDR